MTPSQFGEDTEAGEFNAAVISARNLDAGLREALSTHCAWIVVVRDALPDDLHSAMAHAADADVIVMSRRRVLAHLLPDAVCWRRDTLAAVLARGSGVPAMFQMLRRAEMIGARLLHLPLASTADHSVGPVWAGAVQR